VEDEGSAAICRKEEGAMATAPRGRKRCAAGCEEGGGGSTAGIAKEELLQQQSLQDGVAGGGGIGRDVRAPDGGVARGCPPTPSFLTKTFDLVEDTATDAVVSWSCADNNLAHRVLTHGSQGGRPTG
jgi:hypothetical protein